MRLPDIEQHSNEPLNKTRFSPVLVFAARPWRELKRVRFQRDDDQLGEVRTAYFRADGIESKLEWRGADAPDDVTLFIDGRHAEGRSTGALPFASAILQALGVGAPRIRWRAHSGPAERSGGDAMVASRTSVDLSAAVAEPAISHPHR